MEGLSVDAIKMLALHHAAAHPTNNPHGSGTFTLPDLTEKESQDVRHELMGRSLLSVAAGPGDGERTTTTWQLTTRGKQLASAAAPPRRDPGP